MDVCKCVVLSLLLPSAVVVIVVVVVVVVAAVALYMLSYCTLYSSTDMCSDCCHVFNFHYTGI